MTFLPDLPDADEARFCPEPNEPHSPSTVDVDRLGRAIRWHRQQEFDPHALISMQHFCFDDCAEDIAARYDELASR